MTSRAAPGTNSLRSISCLAEQHDLRHSSVQRVLVAGEPGGGEPAFREQLQQGWGGRVTEAMGVGDIGVSLWSECEQQDGMHLGARGFVHAELIDPETTQPVPMEDGASGELVLTHLEHRAAPLLRFRTRDHPGLADAIRERIRSVLVVRTRIELVPFGTLERSDYKAKLVEH